MLCLASGLGPGSWPNPVDVVSAPYSTELVPQKYAPQGKEPNLWGMEHLSGLGVRMPAFSQLPPVPGWEATECPGACRPLSQGTRLPEPGLVPPSELGISFCPQLTSLLASNPALSLWNLATLTGNNGNFRFFFSSLYRYSKGFPLSYMHTRTHTPVFSPPISLGCPGNFQAERRPELRRGGPVARPSVLSMGLRPRWIIRDWDFPPKHL